MKDAKSIIVALNKPPQPEVSDHQNNLVKKERPRLFLTKQFNIHAFYPGLAVRGISRLLYPLAEAMKNRHKLPKYIIVMPDKDLICELGPKKFNTSIGMQTTLHYIMKELDIAVNRRRTDIADKKEGALPPPNFPTIIWVRMLKRPFIEGGTAVFSLRNKFNNAIEEVIKLSKDDRHRIVSIEIPHGDFDRQGNLNNVGMNILYKEIDRALHKFDEGKIKLLPRGVIPDTSNMTTNNDRDKTVERQLPILKPSTAFIHKLAEQYRRKGGHSQPKVRKRLWSPYNRRRSRSRSKSKDKHRHSHKGRRSRSQIRDHHRSSRSSH